MTTSPSIENEEAEIATAILSLCKQRTPAKTACPSEVARALYPDDWRDHMDAIRNVATRLVNEGIIETTQHGVAVDPATIRGPIRLRLAHSDSTTR